MRINRSPGHAILACLFVVQVGVTIASPQQVYYNSPNGYLRPINNGAQNCGTCPQGTQREAVNGPYCGRCLQVTQTCAEGYYMANGQCQSCSCPGNGDRRFGTSCRVDVDGQVTCDCPSEYTGRDCSQCATGTIQNNQYPYNCLRVNSTNSFSVTCPGGNICNPPQIPQLVRQPRQAVCPYTNQVSPPNYQCPYTNQTNGLCPVTGPCPQQPQPCPVNGPCPQQPQPCPINGPCPQQPQPCPVNGPCPQQPCPPGNGGCPGGCPGNGGCPGGCPGTSPGNYTTTCPCPSPCPCPGNGNSCPGICPTQPCPPVIIPPWTPAPPVCPGPIVCPPPPPPPPCPVQPPCPAPVPCPPQLPCPPAPSPCPNPCQPCPQPPSCPDCRVSCPPCPPQQPCCENNCNPCPDPCQPCPNPCSPCPAIPPCPSCNFSCPPCICPPPPVIETPYSACICDPRGTASQALEECICKVNVQGAHCDQCKPGYFGLTSTRPEGCLACFCSGLSTSCSLTPYYRTSLRTSRSANCTIEITDESHSIVYSSGSSGFSWDGTQATLSKGPSKRLFWSLPSCLKGGRVTSYGGLLSFSRMCSGSGSSLGGDHEVVLVAGSGATVFWTTFDQQVCDGRWTHVDVLLAETAYWSSWKGEQFRRATRGDIMEVLADLQLILVRATFASSTLTTSIKNVSLSTVTHQRTGEGIALQVESCRCPTGYRGLSCESCAPGYYRDTSDMSHSVFGACKPCPCGGTADGCHLSAGQVVCKCKTGFTGPLCQDKEVITVTLDPFSIRVAESSEVDFTCTFTTNSRRDLLLRLGIQSSAAMAEKTTSLTKTITVPGTGHRSNRVSCEVVDSAGVTWAVVYGVIEIIQSDIIIRPPPPRLLVLIPNETFICVDEGTTVALTCTLHSFGMKSVNIEWRKEGNARVIGTGRDMKIHNCAGDDAGTYICSASDGDVTGAGQIALMVRRIGIPMRIHYPVNATGTLEKSLHQTHGGDYPNHPYQADDSRPQADDAQQQLSETINPVPSGHPKAMVQPTEVIAKPGDTVILRCNATGQEPLKFYWKSGSNDYIPSHVRISHGALVFRTLRSQDAGVYFCVAWNHLGQSTARATIALDNSVTSSKTAAMPNKDGVIIETGRPNVELLHPEITARPGENVNFQCRSNQTAVKYVWSRLGEKMPNSSEIRNDGLLTLYRVSEKDQGTYLCTVTNTRTGETTTEQAVLMVKQLAGELLVPPRIIIKSKSPLRVRSGQRVRLECEGVGSPLPNVTWVRSIDGFEKRLVSTDTNKAIYEIGQMSQSDVGKYACNAVSIAGRKSESMSLIIDNGKQCKENEFRCKSGDQCIPRDDRCDNEKDCRDGSDEENCKGSRKVKREIRI